MEETIRTEEHGLSDYIKHEDKGLNRYLKSFEKKETKREYKDRKMEEKQQEWKNKALHGQYTKIADRTDTKKTYKWISPVRGPNPIPAYHRLKS